MSEISKQRLIDGEKLLNRAYEIYEDDDLTMYDLIRETESGKFDTSSNQGEATRMREALVTTEQALRIIDKYGERPSNLANVYAQVDKALSSHTEDTGMQKVREMYDLYKGTPMDELHGEYKRGVEDTLRFLGYKIPGITEER